MATTLQVGEDEDCVVQLLDMGISVAETMISKGLGVSTDTPIPTPPHLRHVFEDSPIKKHVKEEAECMSSRSDTQCSEHRDERGMQDFDGKIPFDFKNWIDLGRCCGNFTSQEIVNTLSMEITFVISGLLFGALTIRRLWDYAVTVILIHVVLSCLVMVSFPLNWSWWVCLVVAVLQMIAFGEAVTFVRRKKQQGKIAPAIELKEPQNYLYKKM